MPRAHRHFLPGHIWHLTHGCHMQKFIPKFARTKSNLRKGLFRPSPGGEI